MKITTVNCGFLETNCYVISNDTCAILIDPAAEKQKIYSALNDKKILAVVLTHGHFDHIALADEICEENKVPLYIHVDDAEMLDDPRKNASYLIPGNHIVCKTAPTVFNGNDLLSFDDISFKVLHTPGHTKGSCCFVFDDFIITGDTLFKNGIGRTDLYGGSMTDEYNSIMTLFNFDKDYVLYPGHGASTSLFREKKHKI